MIRVDVGPRLSRSARRLGDQIVAEVEEKLTLVSRHFGEPHRPSGLGLRKLGRRSYEARVSRGLRIVFIREPDRLTAYDLMDHHQVTQWLKARKGDQNREGKKQPLTAAGLHALRDEYTRTIAPARARAAEILSLECKLKAEG
jgi:hypothetical protein